MEENAKFMQEKRSKVDFGVKDLDKISAFEAQIKASGTPMSKFYDTFKSVKEAEQAKKLKKDTDKEYDFIPQVKPKKAKKVEEFKGIFGDDQEESDEEMDDVERFKLKEERGKKRKQEDSDSEEDEDEGEDDEGEDEEESDEDQEGEEEQDESDDDDDDDEGDDQDVVKDFDGFESDDE